MLNFVRLSALILFLPLMACVGHHDGDLDDYLIDKRTAQDFSQDLAEAYQTYFHVGGMYFSQNLKGFRHIDHKRKEALRGANIVLPEMPEEYNIPLDSIEEFRDARLRLMHVLNLGGRESLPEYSAKAQAAYDCWLHQQAENPLSPVRYKGTCRQVFYENLNVLESQLRAPRIEYEPIRFKPQDYDDLPSAPDARPDFEEDSYVPDSTRDDDSPLPPQNLSGPLEFIVYFDFDKASLRSDAKSVIDQAVGLLRKGAQAPTLKLVGHTDTVGTEKYNLKLSERRVKAVLNALVDSGVDPARIQTFAAGESDPAVKTGDNVREPLNRRVEAVMVVE